MKKLLCLSLVLLNVSCQTIGDSYERYQHELQWKRFREIDMEWNEIYKADLSCEEQLTRLKQISIKYDKYGARETDDGVLSTAKVYSDFKILFVQAKYEEAYAMGMDALPSVQRMKYGIYMMVELAITAKILGRYPEFQQKVDFWTTYPRKAVWATIEFTVNDHCDDSLKQMGILEWFKTLEPPANNTQN